MPIQILLIAFAIRGFQQAWNVEVERATDERRGGQPAPVPRLSQRFGPTNASSFATESRRATEIVCAVRPAPLDARAGPGAR